MFHYICGHFPLTIWSSLWLYLDCLSPPWMSSVFFFSVFYSSTSPSTVITLIGLWDYSYLLIGFFHLPPIVCLLPHPVTSSASGPSLIPVDRGPPFHTYSPPHTHTHTCNAFLPELTCSCVLHSVNQTSFQFDTSSETKLETGHKSKNVMIKRQKTGQKTTFVS